MKRERAEELARRLLRDKWLKNLVEETLADERAQRLALTWAATAIQRYHDLVWHSVSHEMPREYEHGKMVVDDIYHDELVFFADPDDFAEFAEDYEGCEWAWYDDL